jgi:hypothetical protein
MVGVIRVRSTPVLAVKPAAPGPLSTNIQNATEPRTSINGRSARVPTSAIYTARDRRIGREDVELLQPARSP